jgi:hypothetical protein
MRRRPIELAELKRFLRKQGFKLRLQKLMLSKATGKVVIGFGFVSNLGHHIWNEQPAIEIIEALQVRPKIQEFYVSDYDYFDIATDLMEKGARVRRVESSGLFLTSVLFFRSPFFKRATQRRLTAWIGAVENLNPSVFVVAIQIRLHNRCWINELEQLPQLVDNLKGIAALRGQELELLFDGTSTIIRNNGLPGKTSETDRNRIELEKAYVNKVKEMLGKSIQICSLVGESMLEKCRQLSAAHVVIAPIGSGGVLCGWLLRRPVISHGPPSYFDWTSNDSATLVESPMREWLWVDQKAVMEVSNQGAQGYVMTSSALMNEVQKLVATENFKKC